MNSFITTDELLLLAPEISMVALATLVIVLDLVTKKKSILNHVASWGLIIPILLSLNLLDGTSQYAFAGALRIDYFGVFFKLITLIATLITISISEKYSEKFDDYQGEYYALILLSATGMMLLASSVEFITIYIALELSALPLAALITFMRIKSSAESGIKFMILSALSSAILLYGMVLVYGFTGTTYIEDLSQIINKFLRGSEITFGGGALLLGIILITGGFAFKISSAPFHMWAPDVYEGAPTPITAFLSVASKAAGFAIILRIIYSLIYSTTGNPINQEIGIDWSMLIAILSAISMTLGNLIAIQQTNIKRLFAYSTIAQAGYIMVGLAALSSLNGGQDDAGPGGIFFYLFGYMLTNFAAFTVITIVSIHNNSDSISSYSGLLKKSRLLTLVMTISIISLIGLPPSVGFMAKIYIFGSAMDTGLQWLAVFGVLNSVISAFYYLKIIKTMLIDENKNSDPIKLNMNDYFISIGCAFGVVILGVFPGSIIEVAHRAIESIIY